MALPTSTQPSPFSLSFFHGVFFLIINPKIGYDNYCIQSRVIVNITRPSHTLHLLKCDSFSPKHPTDEASDLTLTFGIVSLLIDKVYRWHDVLCKETSSTSMVLLSSNEVVFCFVFYILYRWSFHVLPPWLWLLLRVLYSLLSNEFFFSFFSIFL